MRHPFFFNGFFLHNIKKGFGLRSFQLFLHVCFLLKKFIRFSPISFFFGILENIRPHLSFRITRFKPRLTYSPYGLTTPNSYNLAFKWIIQSSRERVGFSKRLQLFLEIVACFLRQSKANALRIETHFLAQKYMRNLWRRRRSKTVRILKLDLENIYTLQISKRVLRILLFLLRTVLRKPGQGFRQPFQHKRRWRGKWNRAKAKTRTEKKLPLFRMFPFRKKKKFDRRRIILIGPPVFRRQGELIMDKLEGKPVRQPILMRTRIFFESLAYRHARLRESTNYDYRPVRFRNRYLKRDMFDYGRRPYGPDALKYKMEQKPEKPLRKKKKFFFTWSAWKEAKKRKEREERQKRKRWRRKRSVAIRVRVPRDPSAYAPYYLWNTTRAVPIYYKNKSLIFFPIRFRVRRSFVRPMASMFFSREPFLYMREWSRKNKHFRRAVILERWNIRLRRLYLSRRLQSEPNAFPYLKKKIVKKRVKTPAKLVKGFLAKMRGKRTVVKKKKIVKKRVKTSASLVKSFLAKMRGKRIVVKKKVVKKRIETPTPTSAIGKVIAKFRAEEEAAEKRAKRTVVKKEVVEKRSGTTADMIEDLRDLLTKTRAKAIAENKRRAAYLAKNPVKKRPRISPFLAKLVNIKDEDE